MLKTFFAIRKSVDPTDIEFEMAMQAINDRMDKMLGVTRVKTTDYVGPERRAGAYQLR
jgi:hypothetical protein